METGLFLLLHCCVLAFFSGITIASNPERDSLKPMSVPGFNGTTSTTTAPIIEPTLQTANVSSPDTTVDTRPTVETTSNSTAAPPTSFQNYSTRTTVEQPVSNGTSQSTRSTSTRSTATAATTSTETAALGTSTSSNTTAQTTHATINDTSVSHATVNTPTAVPQTINATTWMPETVNGTQSFRLDYSEKTLTILFSVVFGVIVLGMVTYVFHKCKQKIQYLHQPLYNTEEDTVDGFIADDDTLVISGGLYDGHQVYDNPPTATVDQAQFRLEFLTEGSS